MRQGLGLPLDGSAEETGPCQAVRNTIVANAVAIATIGTQGGSVLDHSADGARTGPAAE